MNWNSTTKELHAETNNLQNYETSHNHNSIDVVKFLRRGCLPPARLCPLVLLAGSRMSENGAATLDRPAICTPCAYENRAAAVSAAHLDEIDRNCWRKKRNQRNTVHREELLPFSGSMGRPNFGVIIEVCWFLKPMFNVKFADFRSTAYTRLFI